MPARCYTNLNKKVIILKKSCKLIKGMQIIMKNIMVISCIVVIQGELITNIAQIKGMQIIITNIMVISCIIIIQGEQITNLA
jgi:hypothetical protein